jgi:hypothetical protein
MFGLDLGCSTVLFGKRVKESGLILTDARFTASDEASKHDLLPF